MIGNLAAYLPYPARFLADGEKIHRK